MGLFHQMDGLSVAEAAAGDVRQFEGDGTPYLRVPGLRELLGVRVGATEIPLETVQEYPVGLGEPVRTVHFPLPMVQIAIDPQEDAPVLLRSVQSNDGIWQKGVSVFVRGHWDTPAPPRPRRKTTAPDGLEPAAPGATAEV